MSRPSNSQITRSLYSAFKRGDIDAIVSIIGDEQKLGTNGGPNAKLRAPDSVRVKSRRTATKDRAQGQPLIG